MAQQYSDPTALERMALGRCPECGSVEQSHDGWGGPNGCTLTDYGVAQRLYQFRTDKERDDNPA